MPIYVTDQTPDWLKRLRPENASVFDSPGIKLARWIASLTGVADPQAQVTGIMAPMETGPSGGLAGMMRSVKAGWQQGGAAARAAQAAEMGYTVDALHGRSGDYSEVAIPSWKRSADAGATGQGFYATEATGHGPGIADWYASQAGPRENVMPLKLKLERPLEIPVNPDRPVDDPRPAAMRQLSKDWGLKEQPRFSGSRQLNPDWAEEFSDALRARGYDGVISDLGVAKEYMVLSPQQVRSRFAAFDPSKKDSANILATLVGGVGLGTLMRAGARDDAQAR